MITKHSAESFLTGLGPVIEQIKRASDCVLQEIGLRFEGDPETLEMWRSHGGEVDGERVRLSGERLREVIRASAPSCFALRARNPDFDCMIGLEHAPVCAPVYGPPNVLLADNQRVMGSRKIYRELVAMADGCAGLANTGHMLCVMNDVPAEERAVEMARIHLELSEKPCMGSVASPEDLLKVIELVREASAQRSAPPTWPAGMADCHLLHLINSTPPLVFQANPLKCLRTAVQQGEGCIITSYMMLGATAPVTPTGALVQGYAECLAGLALAQLWKPGVPVIMGLFGTPFSMSAMQPYFGDPLSQTIQLYACALARDLGVPVRGDGGITSAQVDDAQSGYDGARATHMALLTNCDFILHTAGWLASGRTTSVEKFAREGTAIGRDMSVLFESLVEFE